MLEYVTSSPAGNDPSICVNFNSDVWVTGSETMKDKHAPSDGEKSGGTTNSRTETAAFPPFSSGPMTLILLRSSYELFGFVS